jgi:hypothetical protein
MFEASFNSTVQGSRSRVDLETRRSEMSHRLTLIVDEADVEAPERSTSHHWRSCTWRMTSQVGDRVGDQRS